MPGDEESDRKLELREAHEREIALMIVDTLWQSKWIRLALQDYEYRGTGFDSTARLYFRRLPPEEKRPRMQAIKSRLEELVLNQLTEIQYEIYKHKNNKDKRKVTAADLFKPNRRLTVCYGPDRYEVSLTRDDWKVFARTAAGDAEYLSYLKSNSVDPKDVVELESV